MATAAVGLTASPAVADTQEPLAYTCAGGPLSTPVPVSVSVTGDVTGVVHVGDKVQLDGFQITVSMSNAAAEVLRQGSVQSFQGSFSDFAVSALGEGDVPEGSANPGADGKLPIGLTTVPAEGVEDLSFASPASPISVGPFDANLPKAMSFTVSDFTVQLDLTTATGDSPATLTCEGGTNVIAVADVKEKLAPPTSAPPPSTNPQGPTPPPGQPSSGPSDGPTSTPAPGGTTSPSNTQPRAELANTGATYTVPMTATGSALVLLGVGMVYLSRRRFGATELVTEVAGEDAED